jgi:hypothetical protein
MAWCLVKHRENLTFTLSEYIYICNTQHITETVTGYARYSWELGGGGRGLWADLLTSASFDAFSLLPEFNSLII